MQNAMLLLELLNPPSFYSIINKGDIDRVWHQPPGMASTTLHVLNH